MRKNIIAPSAPGIRFDEYGLTITREITLPEWQELLSQTRRVKKAYLNYLSDLTTYGRSRFGDDVVNQSLEQLEFEYADAVKAEHIALTGADLRRRHHLTSEHAYVLGKLLAGDPSGRAEWARLCEEHQLSAFELKRSIEAGEVLREGEIRARAGQAQALPSIQAVRFKFEVWKRQLGDSTQIRTMPPAARKKILTTLSPIIQFAAEIEASLADT